MTPDTYERPDLYDLLHATAADDVPGLLALARAARGPVLELGCGTGRLTLALARHGVRVVAVDRSPAMLAPLRRALVAAPALGRRVTVLEQDMTMLEGPPRFDLALLPLRALNHLDAAGVRRLLRALHAAVHPDGQVVVDAWVGSPALAALDGAVDEVTLVDPATGALHRLQQTTSARPGRLVTAQRWTAPDGTTTTQRTALQLHAREDLRAWATEAGWSAVSEHADLAGTPWAPGDWTWVAHLQRRGVTAAR